MYTNTHSISIFVYIRFGSSSSPTTSSASPTRSQPGTGAASGSSAPTASGSSAPDGGWQRIDADYCCRAKASFRNALAGMLLSLFFFFIHDNYICQLLHSFMLYHQCSREAGDVVCFSCRFLCYVLLFIFQRTTTHLIFVIFEIHVYLSL